MTLLAALTPMPLRAVEPPRPHERQHSSISGQTVLGKHTVAQWRELVDATWGPGLTASEQVEIFDAAWDNLDRDDVAAGRDTVVEAAIRWIESRWPRRPTACRQP